MSEEKETCCFIAEDSSTYCKAPAEFEIWSAQADYTLSCREHVGELLDDSPCHTVYRHE